MMSNPSMHNQVTPERLKHMMLDPTQEDESDEQPTVDFAAMRRESLERLGAAVNRVVELPPQPPTLRGRLGMSVVRLVHRALFWLLPNLRFGYAAAEAALRAQQEHSDHAMAVLRRQNEGLRSQLTALSARIQQDVETRIEAEFARQQSLVEAHLSEVQQHRESAPAAHLDARLAHLEARCASAEQRAAEVRQENQRYAGEAALDVRLLRQDLRSLSDRLHGLQDRLWEIQRAQAGIPPAAPDAPAAEDQDAASPLHAQSYLNFTNRFRGSEESVRERLQPHFDIITRAGIAPGSLVVDLGCGRGEFLDAAREHGFQTLGVDSDYGMVEACRRKGHNMLRAGLSSYLSSAGGASISVLSLLHVIEHVPVSEFPVVFQHIRRVLAPGGIALIETPNPGTLVVGACFFYNDPTHQRPLPADLLRYYAETAGLTVETVEFLNPFRTLEDQIPSGQPILSLMARDLYGPQDYLLVVSTQPAG